MTNVDLKRWIGRREIALAQIDLSHAAGLAATLDSPAPNLSDELPPYGHWAYFQATPKCSDLDADGHPRRGVFLPPVLMPRRMWAGSQIEYRRALRIGDSAWRKSTIIDVSIKQGRSGPLAFVQVEHEISSTAGVSIIERQDIVFRDHPSASERPTTVSAAPSGEQFSRELVPDPVLLFRYSAITFNSHRIHYDRLYATQVEGYPGLVVHGPLTATLLLRLLEQSVPDAHVRRFSFRAMSPLHDGAPIKLCGRLDGNSAVLWARSSEGSLAMLANATIA